MVTQAEVHRWASELARLHERRDKEIVEIQRYEVVQGIVHQDPSTNRFHVRSCAPNIALLPQRTDLATHAAVIFLERGHQSGTASCSCVLTACTMYVV